MLCCLTHNVCTEYFPRIPACRASKHAHEELRLWPYLDMVMSSIRHPMRINFGRTWPWKSTQEAGPGAELGSKPVQSAQRIQCREKQGLTVRGTLSLWNLGVFSKYCKNYQSPSWTNNVPQGFKVFSLVCPEWASILTILTLFLKECVRQTVSQLARLLAERWDRRQQNKRFFLRFDRLYWHQVHAERVITITMPVLLFLIDTSASMNQRTHLGTTYLDIAKGAVETFMKVL